jgi:hypothetical protein
MVVLLRPLRPELDGQDPFQISGLLCQTRKYNTFELQIDLEYLMNKMSSQTQKNYNKNNYLVWARIENAPLQPTKATGQKWAKKYTAV